jgi:iron complex transport system permease protein
MLRERSSLAIVVMGVVASVLVALFALSVGAVTIAPLDTLRVLADRLLPGDVATSTIADPIIWNIRLPRVVAAFGAGAALGIGGATLQGLFRNPVADPQLVGMSSIGSIGVLIGLWVGWGTGGPLAGVIGGAVAGLLGSWVVRVLATTSEGDPSRFILTGIGFGLAISAIVAGAAIAIHDPRIPDTEFWFVGGLSASTWATGMWTTAIAAIALAILMRYADRIDLFSLGMPAARHLGVDVARVTLVCLLAIGAGVGASVGASGVVAFVGLIGGHAARAIVGDHHRRLLPGALFVGGMFLMVADALGRVVGGRFEVPVGLVTAAIGGPYLVWLITRRKVAS